MAAIEATDLHAGPAAPVWRMLGDEQLARAAGRGNDHAFAALYARYSGALRSYCASIVLHSEDAEDAVQATMLKAMRALPGRRPGVPVKPWLYRIAHNESVDVLRRRRAHSTVDEDRVASLAAPGPEAALARRERLAELVVDLRTLPERQRAALIMRELSGLGYEEIAGALEVTPGAVRQLVFEARSTLHEFARGRDVACSSVQRSLSDGDRRRRRGRGVRAHLRACNECRAFDLAITRRSDDLAALPPLILEGTAAAVVAAGGLLGLVGVAGGGSVATLVGGSAAKGIATAALAIAVGTGAAMETGVAPIGRSPKTESATARAPKPALRAAQVRTALAAPTPRVAASASARSADRARRRNAARRRAGIARARARSVAAVEPRATAVHVPRVHVEAPVAPVASKPATEPVGEAAPPVSAAPRPVAQTVRDRVTHVTQQAMATAQQNVAQSQNLIQQTLTRTGETVNRTVSGVQQLIQRILRR
jgi:RNA polymerase sigma factor (sigma-70 family)